MKQRVDKLYRRMPPFGEELDRMIQAEIDRIGEEEAQKIFDELVREWEAGEGGGSEADE